MASDVLRSLEQLQDAVDFVFGRITKRVAMEHERLGGLSKRIQAAKVKVDAISGSKQAITVFSTTKYPVVPSEVMDFRPLFGGDAGEALPVFNVELDGGTWKEDENEGTLELFRFFLETRHEQLNTKDTDDLNVHSLADVHLFKSADLVPSTGLEQPSAESEAYRNLAPPPQSLTRSSNMIAPGLEEYGFKPTLRQVPLFSLPSRLPDLPMVADISWTGSRTEAQELLSIAPSANVRSPQKPEVPRNNKEQGAAKQPEPSLPSSLKTPTTPNTPVPSSAEQKDIKGKGKEVTPPKPPPLPSSPPTIMNPSSSPGPSETDPQRAALLASIRSPSIKLKKTGLIDSRDTLPEQSHDDKSEHPKQPPGLLAEMATTLKMRRLSMKGGTHDASKIPASPSIYKSPLPMKNLEGFIPRSDDVEEDDDDEDDWED